MRRVGQAGYRARPEQGVGFAVAEASSARMIDSTSPSIQTKAFSGFRSGDHFPRRLERKHDTVAHQYG
jgi:hypothetical protein